MSVLDLKMNRILMSISLSTDEVSSLVLNEGENVLVSGFTNGQVRIFNIDKEF